MSRPPDLGGMDHAKTTLHAGLPDAGRVYLPAIMRAALLSSMIWLCCQ